jgi:hypothetical protein
VAVAGPNAIQFITLVALRGTPDTTTLGEFTVEAGETVPFTMSWYPSHRRAFRYRDPCETLLGTETRWPMCGLLTVAAAGCVADGYVYSGSYGLARQRIGAGLDRAPHR